VNDPKLTKEELIEKAKKPAQDAMKMYPNYKGNMEIAPNKSGILMILPYGTHTARPSPVWKYKLYPTYRTRLTNTQFSVLVDVAHDEQLSARIFLDQ
jgi:hypothetical protein